MNLTKRKLLALLSLELLLYSFVYVPIAFFAILTLGIGGHDRQLLAILYIPPGLFLIVNAFIARTLLLKAAFSERNWRLMRFGLKLMALQMALVLLTFVSGELNVAVGCLAIVGIIAAATMESERS